MKLIVTGANGLVGSHLIENFEVSNGDTLLTPSQEEMDITNQDSVSEFFSLHQPDAVMHLAAFTDVAQAEKQRDKTEAPCWIVNIEGTANLIKAVKGNAYFVFISTDVVFSGNKSNPGPYNEDHPTETNHELLSWYGWTKKEGERLVAENLKNAVILRISNPVRAIYPATLDYVRKILSLSDTGKLYPMFDDQYLILTYINEVTNTLKALLEKRATGIFHTSSSNVFTPYKLANLLIEKARGQRNTVKPTSMTQFLRDNPSRYPQYGGLKVEKTEKMLGLKFLTWEEIIEIFVKQLLV